MVTLLTNGLIGEGSPPDDNSSIGTAVNADDTAPRAWEVTLRDAAATLTARTATQGGQAMPLFMDVHESLPEGATARDVAQAHAADVKTQDQYGVNYLRYWVDEQGGKVFCLVEAPDAETAIRVHREAHGLVADRIHEVQEGS